jgi:hypothetical protein
VVAPPFPALERRARERQPPVVARAGTIPALFGALGPGLPVFEALLVFQVS